MSRLARSLAVALCVTAPSLGVSAQSPTGGGADSTEFLRPGDAIQLRFFADSGLSGQFRVDERGHVVLPMLGDRDAVHQAPNTMRTEIRQAYAQYLKAPPDVTVLRRITVLGAVMKPGLYLADPTMSVADVLALAGGPSPDGRTGEVQIRRNGHPVTEQISSAAPIASTPLRSGDALYVPERSWGSRNVPLLLGAMGSIAAIVSVLRR